MRFYCPLYQKWCKLLTAVWVVTAEVSVSGSISPWRVVFYHWCQTRGIDAGFCDICSGFGKLAQQHVLWICGWGWTYHGLRSLRFYQQPGFSAAALSICRPMDVFVQMPQLHSILGCKLCALQLWGFCQAGAISPCCNGLQNRCKVMLEDQVLFPTHWLLQYKVSW